MPVLTQGQTADVTFVDSDSITIQAGSGTATFERPIGTVVAVFSGTRTFGPFSNSTGRVTATVQSTYYEVADGTGPVFPLQYQAGAAPTIPGDGAGAVRTVAQSVTTLFNMAACSDVGDSYRESSYAFSAAGVCFATYSRGAVPLMNMLMGAPWKVIYPRCKSGKTSSEWIASDPAVMTRGGFLQALTDDSYHVLISFPTNDITLGADIENTTIPNLKYMVDQCLAIGKLPWLTLGGLHSTWNATKVGQADTINTWIAAYAATHGLPYLDEKSALADPSTKLMASAYGHLEADGTTRVHPNNIGQVKRVMADRQRLAPFIRQALLAEPARMTKLANPLLGSLSAGIPASWAALSSNSGTPTRVAPTDPIGGWQTTFTAAAGNGYDGLRQATISLASTGFAIGDTVQAVLHGQIVSCTAGVSPHIFVTFNGASGDYTYVRTNLMYSGAQGDTHQQWSPNPVDNFFVLPTLPITIPAGTTSFTVDVYFEADNGATVVARASKVEFYKR